MSSTTTGYRYAPLSAVGANDNRRSLRLLDIEPGLLKDDLNVILRETEILGPQADPSYEALSYVWGPKDTSANIFMGPNRIRFEVSQVLSTALRHLRYEGKTRTVWIDAICINQSDIAERSKQVTIMGDIYQRATRVIVWLGVENQESSHAMHLLQAFGSNIRVDWATRKISPSDSAEKNQHHWADKYASLPYDRKDFDALACLFEREWFERLWIRQEIVLACEAVVQCGNEHLSWECFRNVFLAISTKDQAVFIRDSEASNWITRLRGNGRFRLIYQVCSTSSCRLTDLRYNFSTSKCQDARDRIYAVLSLLYGKERALGITPDYSLEAKEVYKSVTLQFVQTLGDLNILTQCEPVEPFSTPTWVPDWSVNGKSMIALAILPAASSEIMAQTEVHGNILRVAGTIIDTVKTVTNIDIEELESLLGTARVLQGLFSVDDACKPYPAGGTVGEAFIRVLLRDCFNDFLPIVEHAPKLRDAVETMKLILLATDQVLNNLIKEHSVAFLAGGASESLSHYAFFSTTKGYIGLGRREQVKIGDTVCALLGSDMPAVLRHHEKTQYHLIGQSYICGFMYGEAFLGPLPLDWRVSWLQVADDAGIARFLRAYENLEKDQKHLEDPRMKRLSPFLDLSEARSEWGRSKEFSVNVSPDVLRRSGIDMAWFDLV